MAVIVLPDTDNCTACGNVPLLNVIVPVAVPPAVIVRERLLLSTVTEVGLRVSVAGGTHPVEVTVNTLATFPPVPTKPLHDCPALRVSVCLNPQPSFWYAIRVPAELNNAGSFASDEPPGPNRVTVTLCVEGAVTVIGMRPLIPTPTLASADVAFCVKAIGAACGVRLTMIESGVLTPPRFTVTVNVPVMAA